MFDVFKIIAGERLDLIGDIDNMSFLFESLYLILLGDKEVKHHFIVLRMRSKKSSHSFFVLNSCLRLLNDMFNMLLTHDCLMKVENGVQSYNKFLTCANVSEGVPLASPYFA